MQSKYYLMNGFLNFLLHLIFIATFVFLYVVSIIILRPFRKHRKRPVSTIALKMSYLLYLAVFPCTRLPGFV